MGTYVSGCRAQPGGLHLGHVYGCFANIPVNSNVSFVISDVLGSQVVNKEISLGVASDVVAISKHMGFSVGLARESAIRELTGILAENLVRFVSFREIAEVHPPKAAVKTLGYSGSLNDFLFPIYQAAYLLALQAETACYNDDNSRFVDLARRLARRINASKGTLFIQSLELIHRTPTRLLGWDGRRMSKGNRNYLSVAASDREILRFSQRLVGRASSGEEDFDLSPPTGIERAYLKFFGNAGLDIQGSLPTGLNRIHLMQRCLSDYLTAVSKHRLDESTIADKLALDENEMRTSIRKAFLAANFSGGV